MHFFNSHELANDREQKRGSSKAAVISFGSISGGMANNVIPDEVKLLGTVRTFDEDLRDSIENWMKRTVENTASSLDAKLS